MLRRREATSGLDVSGDGTGAKVQLLKKEVVGNRWVRSRHRLMPVSSPTLGRRPGQCPALSLTWDSSGGYSRKGRVLRVGGKDVEKTGPIAYAARI
jgi:hypothetical protein